MASGADTAIDRARASLDAGDRAAAAQTLADSLREGPDDVEARLLYARVLAWDGRYAAADAQYERLLSGSPENVDYLLGRAQVRYWQGSAQSALPLLERARALAPDYEAVWQLEARALAAAGGADNEARHRRLTLQARARFPASDWPEWPPARGGAAVTGVAGRGHLEAGGGYQELDNGLPSWKSWYAAGRYRLGERKALYGQLRRTERFDQADHELQAGINWAVGRAGALTLEGTGAPGADVLPRWSAFAALRQPLPADFGLAAGLRHKRYQDRYLNVLTLTGEKYFGDYYAAWTTYLSKLQGAGNNVANQLRVDRFYRGESRVGLLVAMGQETESVGQDQFVDSDTLSATLTGLHQLTPAWAVTWDLIYHDQDDAYRRGGFRVGLRREL
jgi:YaiO family outer membrane protein